MATATVRWHMVRCTSQSRTPLRLRLVRGTWRMANHDNRIWHEHAATRQPATPPSNEQHSDGATADNVTIASLLRVTLCFRYKKFASPGWRIFEFLDMCEAADISPVVTLNNQEATEDMADLIEYLHGDATATVWGKQRAEDDHAAPYKKVMFEIGNEQGLTDGKIKQTNKCAPETDAHR